MKKRSPAPNPSKRMNRNPESVSRTLDRIAELVPKLVREAFEAHAYGFNRKDRRSIHADNQNQERVHTSGLADPTGTVALEQERARRKTQEAFGDIEKAEDLLQRAYSTLGKVFKTPEFEPLRESLRAGDRVPHNVKRDLEERERYLSKALAEVRGLIRRAG